MALLGKDVAKQVKEILSEMEDEVKILFFSSDDESVCEYCSTIDQLLSELTELSDKLHVEKINVDEDPDAMERYDVEMVPALVLIPKDGKDRGVRFYGVPAGHEFSTFLQDILIFSKQAKPQLSEESVEKLSKIDKPVDIKVFVTTTCPYCPRAVLTAHQIALVNDNIKASMVEANEFMDLSARFGVSSVPHTVINEKHMFVGAYPEKEFVNEVLKALEV
ncbi:MAG: hypothetical protein PWP37_1303 [Thermotogota bacterium]|nr:hypothetical protein [Thermotogota bacterium]MDK2865111.1 hypothetical protein [Thermotogota bacterium]HCZ06763.1 glutaredoxin [Thermotogota bacterium]